MKNYFNMNIFHGLKNCLFMGVIITNTIISIIEEIISKKSFEYISIIGRGGFGKVWKVFFKKNKIQYALKEMSKAKIIDKRSEKSVLYERDLLSTMNHP